MQGQTGIAKKVYECVPISEPWRSFQVLTALRNMTGSTPDVRIVQGCLRDLVDSGLIRRTGTDHYQRIQVEKKTKPQEPKMGEPAKKIETQSEPKRSASPLEMLGELANELAGMAEHRNACLIASRTSRWQLSRTANRTLSRWKAIASSRHC